MPAAQKAQIDRLTISYANMAHAAYKDSLDTAKALQAAVNIYVETPTQANLDAAKSAYKAARQPYSQTEIFRFDEGFVTANDKRAINSIVLPLNLKNGISRTFIKIVHNSCLSA